MPLFRTNIDLVDADTSKAQKALSDAQSALDKVRREKQKSDESIERLFDPEWYGSQGEWKKLDHTCIEKEVGECVISRSGHVVWFLTLWFLATSTKSAYSMRLARSRSKGARPSAWGTLYSADVCARPKFTHALSLLVASLAGMTLRRRARRNTTARCTTRAVLSAGTARNGV